MQRQARRGAAPSRLADEPIRYFTLQHVLPEGHVLALNPRLGTLSWLAVEGTWPRMLMEQQFSDTELRIVLPLLEYHPQYCPHEVLFANFYQGAVSEKTIVRARERLQEALEYGTWDHEMRPLRNVLSRARLKLKDFGMDARSILETGYLLIREKERT